MATVFEIRIDDDWVYNEISDRYIDELEDRIGRRLDDGEYNELCAFIVEEMCAKPLGTSHQVGINTRFGEWFVDSMPNTFGLMLDLMSDGLGCFIEQKIEEKYGKEGE